jgi:heme/copper-type cytochrome/quinol oxidase subunit 2
MSRLLAAFLFVAVVSPAVAQQPAISLAIRDDRFEPAELTVPAGVKVELAVRNERTVRAEFESKALHLEKVVAPGATVRVPVGPLKPGRYEFFDDFNPKTRGFLIAQ